MALRHGLGPVFRLEFVAVPRRWQLYVGRVIFVGLLLAMLWILWESVGSHVVFSINEMKGLSTQFLNTVVLVQLAIVGLGAPAMMAGSICVDKARGTLHHVFVTDLSNSEIVLGKFVARLLSILMMMACGAPVLALGGLIGGLDYEVLLRAYIITTGVALVACSLTMTFSLWARKSHQALLPTYAILGLWCLSPGLFLFGFGWSPWAYQIYFIAQLADPYLTVNMSYAGDDSLRWIQPLAFFAATSIVSGLLILLTIAKLRKVVIGQANRGVKTQKADAPLRILNSLPGPPLDGNPILWREWHRKKPSRWTGRFWTLYGVFSLLASGFAIFVFLTGPTSIGTREFASLVNGIEVAVGLLLLTISATSSLAEERDRGSLDVIMTTPLATGTILRGKWLGSFAMVPRFAILPIWISGAIAMVGDNFFAPLLLIGLILAFSAFITSLGLGLSIWVPRLGRAIAVGITIVLLMNLGLYLAQSYMNTSASNASAWTVSAQRIGYGLVNPDEGAAHDWLLMGNPFVATFETTQWGGHIRGNSFARPTLVFRWVSDYSWSLITASLTWIGILTGLAVGIFVAALATFDRCLGRITTHLRVNAPPRVDPAFPGPNSAQLIRKA